MPLAVELVSDTVAFAALRPEWNALVVRAGTAVFTDWEWGFAWHQRLASERPLRILAVRDSRGTLVGVLPLAEQRLWRAGVRVRRWGFLAESRVGSDDLDLVATAEDRDRVATACASALDLARSRWDVLELAEVPEVGSGVAVLAERLAEELTVKTEPRYVCPWRRLEPAQPFEAFLRRTGRRDNFLRRSAWLAEQPGFQIRCVTAVDEIPAALAELFRLHALRWEGEGGSQGIRGAAVRGFYRDVTTLLAERGKIRLHLLEVGGRAVAAVYGIVHGGTYVYFQSGFDPAWRSRSVGLVLVGETFRTALAEGLTAYDFLHGTEPYKFDWVDRTRKTVRWRVRGAAGAGAWDERVGRLERATRGAARRLLPGAVVERLRKARLRADERP